MAAATTHKGEGNTYKRKLKSLYHLGACSSLSGFGSIPQTLFITAQYHCRPPVCFCK